MQVSWEVAVVVGTLKYEILPAFLNTNKQVHGATTWRPLDMCSSNFSSPDSLGQKRWNWGLQMTLIGLYSKKKSLLVLKGFVRTNHKSLHST